MMTLVVTVRIVMIMVMMMMRWWWWWWRWWWWQRQQQQQQRRWCWWWWRQLMMIMVVVVVVIIKMNKMKNHIVHVQTITHENGKISSVCSFISARSSPDCHCALPLDVAHKHVITATLPLIHLWTWDLFLKDNRSGSTKLCGFNLFNNLS